MYVLTFGKIVYVDGGEQKTVEAETLGFSERAEGWICLFPFVPDYYVTVNNNLASFKSQSLWIHQEQAPRNYFYGTQYNSTVSIVSKMDEDSPKRWQSVAVASNKYWTMELSTPEGQESELAVENFVKKDNMLYASILRDKNTPTEALTGKQVPILHGELLISQVLNVKLTNEDNEAVNLDAVYLGYSPAVGHLLQAK